MRYAVRVEVRKLEGIADPEGRTVERALSVLGFAGVVDVHFDKLVRLVLEAPDDAAAEQQAEEMCHRLLANPVIESYVVDVRRDASAPERNAGRARPSEPDPVSPTQ